MERIVISKSAKRKMSSSVTFPVEIDGKQQMKTVQRNKANCKTEMVVYKTQVGKGKFISETRHEAIR